MRRNVLLCVILAAVMLASCGREESAVDSDELFEEQEQNPTADEKPAEVTPEISGEEMSGIPVYGEEWTEADMEDTWYELGYLKDGHNYYSGYSPLPTGYPDYQDYSGTLIIGGGKADYEWVMSGKNAETVSYYGMAMIRKEGAVDDKCENKAWYAMFDTGAVDRELAAAMMDKDHLFVLEKTGDKVIRHYYGRAAQVQAEFERFRTPSEGTPMSEEAAGKNPIVTSIFTADPAPMVVGDTLYLYTTHDEDELINGFYTMLNWHCYSTKDMVHWTDHGQVFSLDDILWADDRAWAAQAIERNGKFYLYCPVHKKNGGMAIAVGVADSPTGPFRDLGIPLVNEGDWNDIDPTVFIDDDGQAYLYFGNPELRYVLLNENMVSYDKEVGVVKIPMTEEAFGKGGHTTGTTYAEGPWFYKRNGLYYMVYAAFGEGKGSEHLAYSTSTSPTGPWVYGGVLMTEEGGTFTNHPGVVDFKGHSYLFYHTGELPEGSLFHRSVCVAEFGYNEDGSIDTVAKCSGVDAIE